MVDAEQPLPQHQRSGVEDLSNDTETCSNGVCVSVASASIFLRKSWKTGVGTHVFRGL
jgi:hypothetical protein